MGIYHPRRERDQIFRTAQGLITENIPRPAAPNTTVMVDGTAYFIGVGLRAGDVVTNVHLMVSGAAADLTLSKVGLYSKAGVRLAVSADLSTSWQSTGLKTNALSAAYTVTADDGYYVALISKATTTLPTLIRGVAGATSSSAVGSAMGAFGIETGQTDLDATATIALTGSTVGYWVGLS